MEIKNLKEALSRIEELEKENAELKEENEKLRNRNLGGRKKHVDAWMAAYRDFAVKYEKGMSVVDIVNQGEISRRTAYRYLAYYRKMECEGNKSAHQNTPNMSNETKQMCPTKRAR